MIRRTTQISIFLLTLISFAAAESAVRGEAPKVRFLRQQKVGKTTYFQMRFMTPDNWQRGELNGATRWWRLQSRELVRLPRLVPQDDKTSQVYFRLAYDDATLGRNARPRVRDLEFFGKVEGKGPARFLLIYPSESAEKEPKKGERTLEEMLAARGSWVEEAVEVRVSDAETIEPPAAGKKRDKTTTPAEEDLEGQWALAQAGKFALLEAQSPEFGFYGFAREATGRRYSIPTPVLPNVRWSAETSLIRTRTYEITTGAAAIAESMAMERMRNTNRQARKPRTIDVNTVEGIDIDEHPWEKMMGANKPAAEPVAELIPHDNYYLHFDSLGAFSETSSLLDKWGTTLSRAFEVNSKDYMVQQRYEQQLCLRSDKQTRALAGKQLQGVVLTGSDPYLREGSDLAIVFQTKQPKLLLAGLNAPIEQAKKQWGKLLRQDKSEHLQVAVESYTTPLREVSLHRAAFGDYVVYANSLMGMQRIVDAYKGKSKSIAKSLDFQYMRTVFRADDKRDDGFLFVSDAFLRNLVGPALRIKQRRRLEAMTSLYMVTHGALFTAWETGKLPLNNQHMLQVTGLKPDELFTPDGDAVFWDPAKKVAVSSFYNTVHFATPLIEIPIDVISETERNDYQNFRRRYLGLWRQFFDPIGIRLSFDEDRITWETYILPLVRNSEYNRLRRMFGDGTVTLDAAKISDRVMVQFFAHLSPKAEERDQLSQGLRLFTRDVPGINFLGKWVMLRLDDSPVYAKIVEHLIRREMGESRGNNWEDEIRLFFKMPLTVGAEISNPLVFAGVLAAARKALMDALPGSIDWGPMKEPYKGTTIVEIKARPNNPFTGQIGTKEDPFQPAIYYALIDGGFYASLQIDPIKNLIDTSVANRKGKETAGEKVEINTSVYVSPQAAESTKKFARFYLEWETHQRALANMPLLYVLYRTGAIRPSDDGKTIQNAALKYLGFVPVSPDYTAYWYEPKTDEVVNARHGSLRKPKLERNVRKGSTVDELLESFRTIRADLRFREDGVHTTVNIRKR